MTGSEYKYKVVIIGDVNVGKSSTMIKINFIHIIQNFNGNFVGLIHRFKANTFSELGYDTGMNKNMFYCLNSQINLYISSESEPIKITRNFDDKVVELMIWDTAGEGIFLMIIYHFPQNNKFRTKIYRKI